MATIYDYVDKYGDRIYTIEKFNEVDNLIYSSLAYINFKDIVPSDTKTIRLQDAAELFIRTYSEKEFGKLGFVFKHVYKMLIAIKDKPRYKNNLLYNYRYVGDVENQFSALCIKFSPTQVYVAFEGTDEKMSGWREDAELAYKFPVNCQKFAIEYINNVVNFFDLSIYIGGHSKGGNLAMVAGMYAKDSVFRKIKKIYNNDGPGFIRKQFESPEYKKMIKKTIMIIPNYSVVGLMLNHQEEFITVESTRRDVLSHSPLTWKVSNNKFKTTSLSRMSKNIDKSMRIWLLDHTYEERKIMFKSIFDVLKNSGINNTMDLKKIKNIRSLIKNISGLDDNTKKLLESFIVFNVRYHFQNLK